ncbi:MAG: MIP family channel protein, partial [Clostridiales bacterium]|nr:MIP family channel protein [Clostridiales bacterium]
ELIGTMILVFMGCGSAVVLGAAVGGGHLAVALAFGLSIVAVAYVIGSISGCHINPAISLAMLLKKRMSFSEFAGYVIAQIMGAIAGAALLKLIVSFGVIDQTGALGSNGTANVGTAGALVVEVILTAIFVLTVLGVTSDKNKGNVAGIVIGLTLAFVHIVGIPLTGTSVNPARSLGPALLAGGENLANVWIFIVAPLVGAVIAVGLFSLWEEKKSVTAKPNTGKKKHR